MAAVSAFFLSAVTASDFRHADDRLPAAIDDPDVGHRCSIEQGAGKIRRIGGTQMMRRTMLLIITQWAPPDLIDHSFSLKARSEEACHGAVGARRGAVRRRS